MPVVASVKNCEVLADVEVQPLERGKCPFSKVKFVRSSRNQKNNCQAKNCFTEENEVVGECEAGT